VYDGDRADDFLVFLIVHVQESRENIAVSYMNYSRAIRMLVLIGFQSCLLSGMRMLFCIFLHAVDILLIAPPVSGLQIFLNACENELSSR